MKRWTLVQDTHRMRAVQGGQAGRPGRSDSEGSCCCVRAATARSWAHSRRQLGWSAPPKTQLSDNGRK